MRSVQIYKLYHRLRSRLDTKTRNVKLRFMELRNEYYSKLWQDAARNSGADFASLEYGFLKICRNGLSTIVKHYNVMLDNHLTLAVMGNKALTYQLLNEKGYRVPNYCIFNMNSYNKALELLERVDGPVVVKPVSGTGGGNGVTTNISDGAALKQAAKLASFYDITLLAEEQMSGESYRLLYIDGKYVDAVRRDPPVVTGDGEHTISQLMDFENNKRLDQRPITAISPLLVDKDCLNKLKSQGLTPDTKLERGRTIDVKQAINQNSAQENHSIRDLVHTEIIDQGSRLTKDLGVQFAGLDLICTDITVPLSQSGGYFNEVNTTPGIHHHYLVSEPDKSIPVAELLLEHMFENRTGIMIL